MLQSTDLIVAAIGGCTSLKTLYLGGTAIKELPEAIGELTNLKKLAMHNCPAKNNISAVLKEKLHAQGCKITDF